MLTAGGSGMPVLPDLIDRLFRTAGKKTNQRLESDAFSLRPSVHDVVDVAAD